LFHKAIISPTDLTINHLYLTVEVNTHLSFFFSKFKLRFQYL